MEGLLMKNDAMIECIEQTQVANSVGNTSIPGQDQLLLTKFFVPEWASSSIPRPRLTKLLDQGLQYPLTLISAPAGFGKTSLLSNWAQSRVSGDLNIAWVSLDAEDNEPGRFWTYVLSALSQCEPTTSALIQQLLPVMQEEYASKQVFTVLINILCEARTSWVLILDDYHVIHEPVIHQSLVYLIEHLPPTVHIMLASRIKLPFPLPRWRGRSKLLEVKTEQLRATAEDVKLLLQSRMHVSAQDSVVQEIGARTGGWWALIHLLLWDADLFSVVNELHGSNRYILDYVTEVVLRSLDPAVVQFLLHTSMFAQFTAAMCDAVLERTDSRMILEELEYTYLLAMSQDGQGYCYHYPALVAEALQTQVAHMDEEEFQTLHVRASCWYEQHCDLPNAIHHAVCAHAWTRAAELIETITPTSFELMPESAIIMEWLEKLPAEMIQARSHLWQCYRRQRMMTSLPVEMSGAVDALFQGHAAAGIASGMEPSMSAVEFGIENQSRQQEPVQLHKRVEDTVALEQVIPATGHPVRSDQRTVEQPLFEALSEREQQVLHELAHGASNQEIADRLVITVATVKRHMSNVFAKLQAHNRAHAVVQARSYGLLNAAV
jgi:LuxR family maltose regulon positive regulatory protein